MLRSHRGFLDHHGLDVVQPMKDPARLPVTNADRDYYAVWELVEGAECMCHREQELILTAVRLGLPPLAITRAMRKLRADEADGYAFLALILSSGWRPGEDIPDLVSRSFEYDWASDLRPWFDLLAQNLVALFAGFRPTRLLELVRAARQWLSALNAQPRERPCLLGSTGARSADVFIPA